MSRLVDYLYGYAIVYTWRGTKVAAAEELALDAGVRMGVPKDVPAYRCHVVARLVAPWLRMCRFQALGGETDDFAHSSCPSLTTFRRFDP